MLQTTPSQFINQSKHWAVALLLSRSMGERRVPAAGLCQERGWRCLCLAPTTEGKMYPVS